MDYKLPIIVVNYLKINNNNNNIQFKVLASVIIFLLSTFIFS